jgi:hypothetical protein
LLIKVLGGVRVFGAGFPVPWEQFRARRLRLPRSRHAEGSNGAALFGLVATLQA